MQNCNWRIISSLNTEKTDLFKTKCTVLVRDVGVAEKHKTDEDYIRYCLFVNFELHKVCTHAECTYRICSTTTYDLVMFLAIFTLLTHGN